MSFGPGSLIDCEGTLMVWEMFKIYGGEIHSVEAFMKAAPPGTQFGWDLYTNIGLRCHPAADLPNPPPYALKSTPHSEPRGWPCPYHDINPGTEAIQNRDHPVPNDCI